MSRRTCITIIPLLLLGLSIAAETKSSLPDAIAKSIDQTITDEMEKQNVVGVTMGVALEGEIVYLGAHGHQDLENDVPMTLESMIRWGSISKLITAVSAMQLWEQGKLDLDADVRGYVPEFPEKDAVITSRQLLTHQGGIVHYGNGEVIVTELEYDVEHPFESVILSLDKFKESPLIGKPGAQFSYTTHGFILLSAVVERAGDQKFADQCSERIFAPAGMTTAQPDYPWVDIPNRVEGYFKSRNEPRKSRDEEVHWKLAGGGFISSIGDLTSFGAAILEDKLVKPETRELMWTPQPLVDGTPTSRGLGYVVEGSGDELVVFHGGFQNKAMTLLIMFPAKSLTVAFMSNTEYADRTVFTQAVIDIMNAHIAAQSGQ